MHCFWLLCSFAAYLIALLCKGKLFYFARTPKSSFERFMILSFPELKYFSPFLFPYNKLSNPITRVLKCCIFLCIVWVTQYLANMFKCYNFLNCLWSYTVAGFFQSKSPFRTLEELSVLEMVSTPHFPSITEREQNGSNEEGPDSFCNKCKTGLPTGSISNDIMAGDSNSGTDLGFGIRRRHRCYVITARSRSFLYHQVSIFCSWSEYCILGSVAMWHWQIYYMHYKWEPDVIDLWSQQKNDGIMCSCHIHASNGHCKLFFLFKPLWLARNLKLQLNIFRSDCLLVLSSLSALEI